MSTENHQLELDFDQVEQPEPVQDDNDFPLGKACDLSGEGECEACQ